MLNKLQSKVDAFMEANDLTGSDFEKWLNEKS